MTCITPRTLERVYEIGRVDTSDPDACWIWNNAKTGEPVDWYPYLQEDRIHRLVWRLAHGGDQPIPAGLVVRHDCDVKACVNWRHLQIGTQVENTQDQYDRGRVPSTEGMISGWRRWYDGLTDEERDAYNARRQAWRHRPDTMEVTTKGQST